MEFSLSFTCAFIKVGKTFSYGNGRLDDNKALAELGFQVKDTMCLFSRAWLFDSKSCF